MLRYQSLKSLAFFGLNEKRARRLVSDHVAGRTLGGVVEVNRDEQILLPVSLACGGPRMHVGTCSVSQLLQHAQAAGWGSTGSGEASSNGRKSASGIHVESMQDDVDRAAQMADALMEVYAGEHHLLVWHGGEAYVVLQEGAPPKTLLRVLYQAHWLHHHHEQRSGAVSGGKQAAADATWSARELVVESLAALQRDFPGFEREAAALGWDTHTVKMSGGSVRWRTLS